MYYFARLAREIEERLVILFRQSKVIGGLYRSLGQEGESVATAYALKRADAILPLIRNMGALTKWVCGRVRSSSSTWPRVTRTRVAATSTSTSSICLTGRAERSGTQGAPPFDTLRAP
jgi:hypothetical protein